MDSFVDIFNAISTEKLLGGGAVTIMIAIFVYFTIKRVPQNIADQLKEFTESNKEILRKMDDMQDDIQEIKLKIDK